MPTNDTTHTNDRKGGGRARQACGGGTDLASAGCVVRTWLLEAKESPWPPEESMRGAASHEADSAISAATVESCSHGWPVASCLRGACWGVRRSALVPPVVWPRLVWRRAWATLARCRPVVFHFSTWWGCGWVGVARLLAEAALDCELQQQRQKAKAKPSVSKTTLQSAGNNEHGRTGRRAERRANSSEIGWA